MRASSPTRYSFSHRLKEEPQLKDKIAKLYVQEGVNITNLAIRYQTNTTIIKNVLTEQGVQIRHSNSFINNHT